MRIMLVSRVTHFHRPGGMPHVLQDRAEALAALGHEVHVVTTTTKRGDSNPEGYKENGVLYRFLRCEPMQWTREFAEECEKLYRVLRPDILHFESFDRRYPWWPESACVTMHGFGWGAMLTRWNMYRAGVRELTVPYAAEFGDLRAEAWALRSFRTVIGVSSHEVRMLRDEYGLSNVQLVYNPIAPYFFTDACSRAPEYFLCAAVSGQKERGFDIAERACKAAGVELRVDSKQPRRHMPRVYDGAIALLLPTYYAQGFDLAVCEARARGVPAIMSATGSYLAEAQPHDTLFPCGDVDALARILRSYTRPKLVWGHECDPRKHAEAWLEAIS